MTSQTIPQDPAFKPIRVEQVELGDPLPDLAPRSSEAGTPYETVQMLVRLHTRPVGMIEFPLDPSGASLAADYAPRVWSQLAGSINDVLAVDNFPPVDTLPLTGIKVRGAVASLTEREAALKTAPMVSIIIPTHERVDQLERCLLSFKTLVYPDYEIIVVDNQPKTTDTADMVERLRPDLPTLRYLREDRRGVSAARNGGIAIAKGEILAFTDDDVVVDPYWLIELVRGFEAEENVACVTGLLVPMQLETWAQLLFERYAGFNRGYTRNIFDLGEHRLKNLFYPYSVGHCGTGASMAFTRKAALLIGGQDPALGAGSLAKAGGDIDSFFQVISRGYQLVYNPTSIAFHENRRSYDALRRQVYNYGVGLTAYLTKCLLTDVRRVPGFLARIPAGMYMMFASGSKKNTNRGAGYPPDLNRAERSGMIYGPLAYIRSVMYVRGEERTLGKNLSHG